MPSQLDTAAGRLSGGIEPKRHLIGMPVKLLELGLDLLKLRPGSDAE